MLEVMQAKKENMFQKALEFLVEYKGVKQAAVFDSEGLVVGYLGSRKNDDESLSALLLLTIDQTNRILEKIAEKPVLSMVLKTDTSWLTLTRIDDLILFVSADAGTDELLKVRIGRAAEMIKAHLQENYHLPPK